MNEWRNRDKKERKMCILEDRQTNLPSPCVEGYVHTYVMNACDGMGDEKELYAVASCCEIRFGVIVTFSLCVMNKLEKCNLKIQKKTLS